jgi:hypothetical protein
MVIPCETIDKLIVKLKYEGISGKYDDNFQLNDNDFFQLDDKIESDVG